MGEKGLKTLPSFDFVSLRPGLENNFNKVPIYRWSDEGKLVSKGYISAKPPTMHDGRGIHPEECSEFGCRLTEYSLSGRDDQ